MTTASCLCGDVAWAVDGRFSRMSHCHCRRCRKTHGTPYATYVAAPEASFRWTRGEADVVRFPSSPGVVRPFCGRCGATAPWDPQDGLVFMPAGALDGDPGVRAAAHIFVASKAPWFELTDAIPRFDAYPPGTGAPVLPGGDPPAVSGAAPGAIAGSCLCGGVGWELEAPAFARFCHCGRCRKGRGAAFASNLGTAYDRLRFVRGEERIASFKVPEARFFRQVFCLACGSKLPNRDAERGIAIVPMGGLDGDPGIRPAEHIFVGSKAPWDEITDGLPQWEAQRPAP